MYLKLTSSAIIKVANFFPQDLTGLFTEQINLIFIFPNLFIEAYMGYILIVWFLFHFIFKIFILYWSIVDLQCCVTAEVDSKVIQFYIYIYLFFFKFFSHLGYYRIYFFNTSLLEYNCFTVLCQFLLYNKVNQPYAYIYPHIPALLSLPPTPPIPPLQVVAKHQADLPVLCGCFPLAVYFTFGSIYMSVPLSHFVPAYPSPSLCPQVHSLHLHLYSCPAPRFFRTIFFLIPYICVTIWYLFFSF